MTGFNNHYGLSPQSTSSPKSPNGVHSTTKTERRSSQSSSDDGSFGHRDLKTEADQDDDGNALTSQTLNADGTPKRPMNAFMIFARRRRPQVSAQHQSMRTGEISKILSREWVSMPPSEKQFYLEQAKQLKENFNSKYPDYVYRRRPNNSRKRRRSDSATMRPVDHTLLGDHHDDLNGSFDIDASPTEDDQLDGPVYHHRSPPQELPHSVAEQKFNLSHPRSSVGHPYASEHFRQDSHRLSYSNGSDRVGPGMSGNPSNGVGLNPLPYSYGPSSGHAQSPPLFGTDSVGSQQGWQHKGSWIGGGQDRAPHSQKHQYSSGSWSSANDSTSTATSGSSNFFPTLNTPFYPNQSSSSSFITSSSSQQTNSTSQYESVSSLQPREFGPRSYGGSSSSGNSYSLSRDPFLQRTLPPMQLSGYSPSQPITSSGNLAPSPASLWRD